MTLATRVTGIGMSFVVPILLGAWLDRQFGLSPWGVLGGVVLGFTTGMLQVLALQRRVGGGGGD